MKVTGKTTAVVQPPDTYDITGLTRKQFEYLVEATNNSKPEIDDLFELALGVGVWRKLESTL